MPMIENMNIRSMSRRPREPIAGADDIRELKMICSCLALLISLKTLPILRVLKIVEVAPRF